MMMGRKKYTAELLVLEQSAFEFELIFKKFKGRNFPGIAQNPAMPIKAVCRIIRWRSINLVFVWNKLDLPEERKDFIILPIDKKGYTTYCINLLKPTVYLLNQQVLHLRIFLSVHAVFMCFVII
jgi:hypothetical protein